MQVVCVWMHKRTNPNYTRMWLLPPDSEYEESLPMGPSREIQFGGIAQGVG